MIDLLGKQARNGSRLVLDRVNTHWLDISKQPLKSAFYIQLPLKLLIRCKLKKYR